MKFFTLYRFNSQTKTADEIFAKDISGNSGLEEGLYAITDAAQTTMWLAVGSKKALLMDTGLGFGNIYQYVRLLTDKPLTVWITHGHVDHAMGSGTFPADVEVRMNQLDHDIYKQHGRLDLRQGYLKSMLAARASVGMTSVGKDEDAGKEEDLFAKALWPDPLPTEDMLPLQEGDTLDLGGEIAEVCPGAGHTRGCLTFLMRKGRELLSGDACNTNVFLWDDYSLSVENYKASMQRLEKATQGRYDTTLLCHGTINDAIIPNTAMIPGAIYLCDKIIKGQDRHLKVYPMGRTAYSAKRPIPAVDDIGDHSTCNILYNPHRLHAADESAEWNNEP